VERVPSKYMATFSEYLQTWNLKLNTTKTVSAVFHFNIKEATREVKVNHNNDILIRIQRPHIHLTDRAINDALVVVTGCLRPTPADNLPTGHPTC